MTPTNDKKPKLGTFTMIILYLALLTMLIILAFKFLTSGSDAQSSSGGLDGLYLLMIVLPILVVILVVGLITAFITSKNLRDKNK